MEETEESREINFGSENWNKNDGSVILHLPCYLFFCLEKHFQLGKENIVMFVMAKSWLLVTHVMPYLDSVFKNVLFCSAFAIIHSFASEEGEVRNNVTRSLLWLASSGVTLL